MIYIVEDDSSIRELEQYALQSNGYETTGCEDAASFWAALRSGRPDLVILDVMLPDEDGYQILAKLRADPTCAATPVIMVTAKTSEIDVVKGLDHGADDYLCKPFGIMEFISRVRAVLRRAAAAVPAPAASTLRFGDIVLDDVSRTVRVGGVPVELTFKEYALLQAWQMPAIGCPCCTEVGLIIAPVPANTSRWILPRCISRSSGPQRTAAEQPQPEPPACASCSSPKIRLPQSE